MPGMLVMDPATFEKALWYNYESKTIGMLSASIPILMQEYSSSNPREARALS